jgi:hypothetical protein
MRRRYVPIDVIPYASDIALIINDHESTMCVPKIFRKRALAKVTVFISFIVANGEAIVELCTYKYEIFTEP